MKRECPPACRYDALKDEAFVQAFIPGGMDIVG